MKKLIPLLGFLVIINVFFNLLSCSKDDSDIVSYDYSEWAYVTEADSVIYAKTRTAYLADPANAGSVNSKIMQFLSAPYAVRTKAVGNGMNYQFACREDYVVTVYKGIGDEIGKVMEIEVGCDDQGSPRPPIPPLPEPRKRDTIPY